MHRDWPCRFDAHRLLQLYDSFEKRTKIRLNKFIRDGTLVKKYVLLCLPSRACSF